MGTKLLLNHNEFIKKGGIGSVVLIMMVWVV